MKNNTLHTLFFSFVTLLSFFSTSALVSSPTLTKDLDIILSKKYTTSPRWQQPLKIMKKTTSYSSVISEKIKNFCQGFSGQGLIIVGPSEEMGPYLLAKTAHLLLSEEKSCQTWTAAQIKMDRLLAGHSYVGDMEKAWQEVVEQNAKDENIIFFLTHFEHLLGAGSHEHKATGLERELIDALSYKSMRLVTYLTLDQYEHLKESQYASVLESLTPLFIENFSFEPWNDFVQAYLTSLSDRWTMSEETLHWLFDFQNLYNPNEAEPRRTINLLQKSMAQTLERVKSKDATIVQSVHIEKRSIDADDSDRQWVISFPEMGAVTLHFDKLVIEKGGTIGAFGKISDERALKIYNEDGDLLDTLSGHFEGAFDKGPYQGSKLVLKLDKEQSSSLLSKKSELSLSKVTLFKQGRYLLSKEVLLQESQKMLSLPLWSLQEDWSLLASLRQNLSQKFIGHSRLIEEFSENLMANFIVGNPEKPMISLLLAGVTGTGKSYLSKVVALELKVPRIVFDMTQYQTPSSIDQFEQKLKKSLMSYPYAVYVFEEIDKVSPLFLNKLYFILDEGCYYPKDGRPLSAHHALIFMTTNAGETGPLTDVFRPSFLNRFEIIEIFKPFQDKELIGLTKEIWRRLSQEIEERRSLKIEVSENFLSALADEGKSQKLGARPIERLIQKVLKNSVANLVLKGHRQIKKLSFHTLKVSDNDHLSLTIQIDDSQEEVLILLRNIQVPL